MEKTEGKEIVPEQECCGREELSAALDRIKRLEYAVPELEQLLGNLKWDVRTLQSSTTCY